MTHGIHVVRLELVHDAYFSSVFSKVAANFAARVGELGAGIGRVARHAGHQDAWVAPIDCG